MAAWAGNHLIRLDFDRVRRYLTIMKTSVSSKGQIVLPADLREQDRVRPGEQFEIERLGSGQYLLSKSASSDKVGVLEWLRACPEKNWFRPLPPGSTDEINAKNRQD